MPSPYLKKFAPHGILIGIRDLGCTSSHQYRQQFGGSKLKETENIVSIVLKAVAVGMGVSSVVLGIIGVVDVSTQVILLGIGLAALAIAALQNE
jgi:hypothetical protein